MLWSFWWACSAAGTMNFAHSLQTMFIIYRRVILKDICSKVHCWMEKKLQTTVQHKHIYPPSVLTVFLLHHAIKILRTVLSGGGGWKRWTLTGQPGEIGGTLVSWGWENASWGLLNLVCFLSVTMTNRKPRCACHKHIFHNLVVFVSSCIMTRIY